MHNTFSYHFRTAHPFLKAQPSVSTESLAALSRKPCILADESSNPAVHQATQRQSSTAAEPRPFASRHRQDTSQGNREGLQQTVWRHLYYPMHIVNHSRDE